MKLPDGTILMHGKTPYDPVKAHEYYLRTRKLKGRKKGQEELSPFEKRRSLGKKADSFTVRLREGGTAKLTPQQLAEQKVYAAKRVADIKKKLTELNSLLKKKMAEARKSESESKKPPTAAEKAKANREAKQYRSKHQQELANKGKAAAAKKPAETKPKTDTVEGLKQQISEIQNSLKAAVERQRSLSSATKNG